MKWVKHYVATWDDEKIARLVGGGGVDGLAAYGVWWRVLEIVAAQVEGKSSQCSVTYPVSRWSLLLSLRGSHVRHWVEKLAVTTILTAEWTESELTVTIPNLLKYRDEYARKSGHCQAQEVDIEEKKIQKKNIYTHAGAEDPLKALGWQGVTKTPEAICVAIMTRKLEDFPENASLDSAYMIYCRLHWFEEFWALYWRKDDKRTARAAYFRAVTTMRLKDRVEEAVLEQTPEMSSREKKFQPLAATWLNRERWTATPELPLEATN